MTLRSWDDPGASTVTVSTLFGEFRDSYLRTIGNGAVESNTLYTAKIHLNHISQSLGEKFSLETLGIAQLQRYVDRRAQKVAAVTIQKEIATLRAAWNWACRMKMTRGEFPGLGLVYPKGEDKLPFMGMAEIERRLLAGGDPELLWECLYLTHSEVDELLDHVQRCDLRPWIYPAFVFTAHTGARRSEMMRARVEDVDMSARTVTIREKKRVKGRRTTRRVPISTRLAGALNRRLHEIQGNPILFDHEGKELTSRSAHVGFNTAVRSSKWAVLRGWHMLRHSFISALASHGVDQRVIDDFVGHQTEEQRRRYRHLHPSTQSEAIRSVFG